MKVARLLSRINSWVAAACGLALLFVALSTQSIDMDEAQTWDYARLHSLGQVLAELRSDPNSEAQMPLGMMAFWGWGQLVGTGEYALRSFNLLWGAITLAALALVGRQMKLPWLPLLFAIQPFVWYSMDQARTPIMQMAGGALLLAGTAEMLRSSPRVFFGVLLLCAGSLILCGASMLGTIPMAVITLFLLASAAWRRMVFSREFKTVLLVTVGLLGTLGLYYATTLVRGAGGMKLWAVTPSNLFFVAYEFLGYAGLGPGRQELREIMRGMLPASLLWPFIAGWLALTIAYLTVLLAAIKSWLTRAECGPRQPPMRLWLLCFAVPLMSALLLFCLAVAVGFPFWGRHLAGVVPFTVSALAVVIDWSTQGLWRRAGRIGSVGVILLLAISSGLVRFSPAHRHDDYRSAAKAAVKFADEGLSIWWVADHSGGEYYGLQLLKQGPGVQYTPNRPSAPVTFPEVIILSRPENFDRYDTAQSMSRSAPYKKTATYQAFEIWELQLVGGKDSGGNTPKR